MDSRKDEKVYCDRTLRRKALEQMCHHAMCSGSAEADDGGVGTDAHDTTSVGAEAFAVLNAEIDVPVINPDNAVTVETLLVDPTDGTGANLNVEVPDSDESDFSSENSDDDEEEQDDLASQLRNWILESGLPLSHANSLLRIMRPHFPFLPKDSRTLLRTERHYEIDEVAGGFYHHFGIKTGIESRLMRDPNLRELDEIQLQLNVDGLPLFKSSTDCFWPILGMLPQEHKAEPFVIGLWVGTSKPTDANLFLEKFVDEMTDIEVNGITFDNDVQVKISNFICDTPARAFIKKTKGHTGYYGCDFCEQSGHWNNHRMTFPQNDASPRTDTKFDEMTYDDHQLGESTLKRLNIGMISQFPSDYMHLVCLGVVKKLVTLWKSGPLHVRLGGNVLRPISNSICEMKKHLPREFLRKGRSLDQVDRWKATEFRTFLLYTGPVVLKGKLSKYLYENFMLLFVSITLLCSSVFCADYCDYANELLCLFVGHFSEIYGAEYVVYNIHGLTHLASHARRFGPLHTFSSFPFENYLQTLKRVIRKPNCPLPQAIRRIKEKVNFIKSNNRENVHCKKKHNRGPLPDDIEAHECMQFNEMHARDYVLATKAPDNAIYVINEVFLIQNIIVHNGSRKLVCRKYLDKDIAFDYPVNSDRLNIHAVKNLGQALYVICPKQINFKLALLPEGAKQIAIPLL